MLLTDWLKRLTLSRPTLCARSRRQGTRFVDVAAIANQPETLEKRALLSAANLPLTDIAGNTGFVLEKIDNQITNFGNPLRAAGDVNGDGFEDMILGSFYENNSDGAAYVLFGKSTGFSPPPDLDNLNAADGFQILGSDDADAGVSVSGGGDVNGDGFDDLVVTAANYTRANNNEDPNVSVFSDGYVIFGKANNTDVQLSAIDLGASDSVGFRLTGFKTIEYNTADSVATGGDINGDGFDDVVFGSKQSTFGSGYIGAAYVVFGRESGFSNLDITDLNGTAGFSFTDSARGYNSSTAYIGAAVSIGGDINGDGFDDLVVGAPGQNLYRNGVREYDGEAYVVFGRSDFSANPEVQVNELDGTNGFVATGLVAEQARTGTSVSSGGDINGDGVDDFVIGAPGDGEGYGSAAGRAYVVFGKVGLGSSGTLDLVALSGTDGFVLDGGASNDLAGTSVSITGDINGDGFDDVVVGAPSIGASVEAPNESDNGTVYIIFGDSSISVPSDLGALNGVNGFAIEGVSSYNAGQAVAHAGDVNGDGFDDLLISEPNNSSGVVFGFFGKEFGLNDGNGGNGELGNGVHHIGDETAETITATQGNGAADILVGGGGNDTLEADGGSDVLIGGSGDDTLVANLSNFSAVPRFDGGTGVDILTGDASFTGATIDLTALPGNRINDIEVIDLEDSAVQTLTLDLATVLAITGAGTTIASSSPFATNDAHTLTILRDTDDTINIGNGWTQGANEMIDGNTFEVFTQDGATVRIQSANTATGDIDGNGSFDTNDSFLINIVFLGADDTLVSFFNGGGLSTAEVRAAIDALTTSGALDVDGTGTTDTNDTFLVNIIQLGATDVLVGFFNGGGLSSAQVRANVNALNPSSGRAAPPVQAPAVPEESERPEIPSFLAPLHSPIAEIVTTSDSNDETSPNNQSSVDVPQSAKDEGETDVAFLTTQLDVTMDLIS